MLLNYRLEGNKAIENYQPYYATCAEMYKHAGKTKKSIMAYQRAITLTKNMIERRFLEKCLKNILNES
jgi:predicted RNA polymerase sigma factor